MRLKARADALAFSSLFGDKYRVDKWVDQWDKNSQKIFKINKREQKGNDFRQKDCILPFFCDYLVTKGNKRQFFAFDSHHPLQKNR